MRTTGQALRILEGILLLLLRRLSIAFLSLHTNIQPLLVVIESELAAIATGRQVLDELHAGSDSDVATEVVPFVHSDFVGVFECLG